MLQKSTGKNIAECSREARDQIKRNRSNGANLPIKANMTLLVTVQQQQRRAEEKGPQTCWKHVRAPTCEFLPSPAWPCAGKRHLFPAPSPLHRHAGSARRPGAGKASSKVCGRRCWYKAPLCWVGYSPGKNNQGGAEHMKMEQRRNHPGNRREQREAANSHFLNR